MDKLMYPILWINESEKSLGIFLNEDQLTSCSPGSQDFFNDLLLCCPDGTIIKVEKAIKIGRVKTPPDIYILKILFWIGLGLIRVKLLFRPNKEAIPFAEFIKKVIMLLREDDEMWDSDGELDQLVENIKASSSFSQLIEVMKKRCWPSFTEADGPWYR
jgi:hypothetical protein